MIGISTNWTAWINKKPIPGHWKTVSVIIENAIRVPIFIPAIVITGISPFFNACLYLILFSLIPRARANLI